MANGRLAWYYYGSHDVDDLDRIAGINPVAVHCCVARRRLLTRVDRYVLPQTGATGATY